MTSHKLTRVLRETLCLNASLKIISLRLTWDPINNTFISRGLLRPSSLSIGQLLTTLSCKEVSKKIMRIFWNVRRHQAFVVWVHNWQLKIYIVSNLHLWTKEANLWGPCSWNKESQASYLSWMRRNTLSNCHRRKILVQLNLVLKQRLRPE